MERAERRLLLRDRPALHYDLASINIGSTPQVDAVPGASAHAVAVKPIHQPALAGAARASERTTRAAHHRRGGRWRWRWRCRADAGDARLSLSALPLLDGAQECVAQGIVSSLQASNVRLRRALHNQDAFVAHPRYPLLFDPQTAGGLLASVPADAAPGCVDALRAAGYADAVVIGQVLAQGDALARITLTD